jgi:retron-type reverse transcriptase
VVHHLLVSHQEQVFEPRFIHDSYACRKGKGTLAASDRLMTFLRRVTANGKRSAWALKLDVASFFPSIHKAKLFEIIAQRIKDPELLWLTRTVLFHDPTTDYRHRQGAVVLVVRQEAARHSHAVATRLPSTLLIPLGTETIFSRAL